MVKNQENCFDQYININIYIILTFSVTWLQFPHRMLPRSWVPSRGEISALAVVVSVEEESGA